MSRVLVTGTSVETSRRALELAAAWGVEGADGAAGAEGARLFCTAGVHPHEAKGFGPSTVESLRPLLRAAECVAVGTHLPLALPLTLTLTLTLTLN